MSKLFDSLERADQLIRRRATGDPDAFAHKLGIHRSTLFCWIRQLREQYGCPIEYDTFRKMRLCFPAVLFLLIATDIHAQRCKVREKYSLVSDTTSWVFGRKDFLQIYVDKTDERDAFILLSVIMLSPTNLVTSIEDSVTLSLENGQSIKLANYKNMMPRNQKIFAITAVAEVGHLVYLLPVTHDELRQLSKSKIKSFNITVQVAINAYTGSLDLKRRMFVKCTRITKSNEKLSIDFVGSERDRNVMSRSAPCALKYIN